ncbi:hypothetical protein ACFTY8_23685 [Streptomyces mirabilis]|uniref:hypothetical protein n=1 Tax=Streptomyces mirabilis TaxID=68239 RepID=UPI003642112D
MHASSAASPLNGRKDARHARPPRRREPAEEPAEHERFACYLQALEAVAEADEADLVAAVLRDQDMTMADSAACRHLDRRAADLLTGPAFTAWARTMTEVFADRDFLTLRLREWTLLRTIALGKPWTAEDLTSASDWFQRTATTMRFVVTRGTQPAGRTRTHPPRTKRSEPSAATPGSAQLT